MAANIFDLNYKTVALVAATAKTVVGLKAPANIALRMTECCISLDGATSTNAPAVVDFNRCTFATNAPGTNSSAATLQKRDPGRQETIQTTGATAWSAEPTVLTAQHTKDVAQYMGVYHYVNPFSSPHIIPGGQGFAITANSPNNVNCSGHITAEE